MSRTYVALDLETTGLDPRRDAIIEIGALRFQGTQEIDSYSTLINPGRRIPSFITELTGITSRDVANAPLIDEVIPEVRMFVGDSLVVGHNVSFDLGFLYHSHVLRGNGGIDTFELSNILVPHARRYSLTNLVAELGLQQEEHAHRALDDARMAHALYVELFARAQRLPAALLEELFRLGEHVNWGARYFFKNALQNKEQHKFQGGLGAQLAAQLDVKSSGPLFLSPIEGVPLEPSSNPLALDVTQISAQLAAAGPVAKLFADYEVRPQQREMLTAVARAFNQSAHLMVEAGTGTGKSLAYLIPALQWAVQNNDRVVISTNTINLQEQLAENDIPLLRAAFPIDFRATVLKGRTHYLCRRQFNSLRQHGPSDKDEMRVLARILLWLPNTLDGDGDDLFLPTAKDRAIWARLSASRENCEPHACPFYGGAGCFFYRARARAERAHLLVVNHALLLADAATENRVLPEYEHLIIDEAHHLERATTESLHFTVNWFSLRYTLDELLKGHGDYPSLIAELQQLAVNLPRATRHKLQERLLHLEDAGEKAKRHLQNLFDSLALFLDEQAGSRNSKYDVRLRITESLRTQPGWDSIEITWDAAAPPFTLLVEELGRLVSGVGELSTVEVPELESPRSRLIAVQHRLQETLAALHSLIAEPGKNIIHWLQEARNHGALSLHAVPLRVGQLVREQLFEKKKSVILTSATLRIGGTFDYLRERLEAREVAELSVGSPFDYGEAALFYAIKGNPAPGQPGYQKVFEETLLALCQATEGRTLALFTSYNQLRATAKALTKPLARAKINVYAQGKGNSRAQLLESFRTDERAVLLGTRSFWEGVDIPGDALSCLVIAKLPFDVPNDPIVQARAEICDNPFSEYSVPEAILRFLQGFGRLIRTRTDRGIVVALDARLLTKGYGRRFLDSLPAPTVRTGTRQELPEIATRWLAGAALAPEEDLTADEPWHIPPPEEPPWW